MINPGRAKVFRLLNYCAKLPSLNETMEARVRYAFPHIPPAVVRRYILEWNKSEETP